MKFIELSTILSNRYSRRVSCKLVPNVVCECAGVDVKPFDRSKRWPVTLVLAGADILVETVLGAGVEFA